MRLYNFAPLGRWMAGFDRRLARADDNPAWPNLADQTRYAKAA